MKVYILLISLFAILLLPVFSSANMPPPPTEIFNLVQKGPHVCVFLGVSGDLCIEDTSEGDPIYRFLLERTTEEGMEEVFSNRSFSYDTESIYESDGDYWYIFAAVDSCVPVGEAVYTFSSPTLDKILDIDTIEVASMSDDCTPVSVDYCLDIDFLDGAENYEDDDITDDSTDDSTYDPIVSTADDSEDDDKGCGC